MGEAEPTPEDYQAAGLYDPDAEHAARQLELLRYLAGLGVGIDEMAAAPDRLPTLGSRVWIDHDEHLTLDEVAGRTGIDRDTITAIWRAVGFVDPDDRDVFTPDDVAALGLFEVGAAVVGRDHAMQFARVVGHAMARIASSTVSFFVVDVGRAAVERDPVGLELARINVALGQLLPQLEAAMSTILRHHLRESQRSLSEIGRPGMDYDELPYAVGFVDLVDSTVLSRTLDPAALGRALTTFEATMADLVTGHGGRLVKLIGDEAMFVCAEPSAACDVALTAVDAFRDHAVLPQVRAGLAFGDVLLREGDVFGPVVNLAARAVKLAAPGSVVVTAALAHDLGPGTETGYALGPAREESVKGFDVPVVVHEIHRSRPASEGDAAGR